jgi:GTP cyclohydrolase II
VVSVDLVTNNPQKLAALVDAGIAVRRRVALPSPANPHNIGYLNVKRTRTGHLIDIEEPEPAAKAG